MMNLDIRWRLNDQIHAPAAVLRRKDTQHQLTTRLGVQQSRAGRFGETFHAAAEKIGNSNAEKEAGYVAAEQDTDHICD